MKIKAKAYAKINLTLDILGKREDGYHALQMLMQSVSLHDIVTVELRAEPGIVVTADARWLSCDRKNTAYLAAAYFLEETGVYGRGVSIHLQKRIPAQAGLAGGSADAAAVILALNELCCTGLKERALCKIGARVGADVPFCLLGGTMLAEGSGEILSQMPSLGENDGCFVLVKPMEGISTSDAYRLADSVSLDFHPDTSAAVEALCRRDIRGIAGAMENSFERVYHKANHTLVDVERIDAIKEKMLQNGALGACMTGSGTTVFGFFDRKETALACEAVLGKYFENFFFCTPVPKGCELETLEE